MQTPKQLTRIGIFYLEEAVLDVLFEVMERENDSFLRAVDIGRNLRTHEEWRESGWLHTSILYKLKEDGRVEVRRSGTGAGQITGWRLTNAEYAKRRDTESSS